MDTRAGNMELLRRSAFYAAAGEAAMADLVRLSFVQLLPRGTVVFEQDGPAEFLHILLSGSVGLQARAETGGRTVVEIFGAGEVFLAPALLLHLPYLASAVALTEVRIMMIPGEPFREAVQRDLRLAGAAIELLSRHWRLMVDQVVDLKLRSAEARVARFIEHRVPPESGGGIAALPEPRTALAARLGMTPETLSRSLASLEDSGRLRRTGGGASVADSGALRR